jgi:hypothetical protein
MKCHLCEQKKAKRSCPALNNQICAHCCGEKRVLEINCPESCDYLHAARQRDREQHHRVLRLLNPQDLLKYRNILSSHQDALANIEYAIGRERMLSHGLTDNDVAEAITILLETYKAEDNGILYEKTSDNLRVEPARRELRSVIEKLRNPEEEENRGVIGTEKSRMPLSVIIQCLEFILAEMKAYQEKANSESEYIDLLARMIPREEKKTRSIIFP